MTMFGLELLIAPLISQVAGHVFGQKAAEIVAGNPELTTVAGGSPIALFGFWLAVKFIKMPEKMIKFRKFLRRFRKVGHKVLDEADALDKKLQDECAGGVCELPEDK